MKIRSVSTAYLLTLIALLTACQPNADVGKDGKTLDVAAQAADIEARIKTDVMGYQFVDFALGSLRVSRAGGNVS